MDTEKKTPLEEVVGIALGDEEFSDKYIDLETSEEIAQQYREWLVSLDKKVDKASGDEDATVALIEHIATNKGFHLELKDLEIPEKDLEAISIALYADDPVDILSVEQLDTLLQSFKKWIAKTITACKVALGEEAPQEGEEKKKKKRPSIFKKQD